MWHSCWWTGITLWFVTSILMALMEQPLINIHALIDLCAVLLPELLFGHSNITDHMNNWVSEICICVHQDVYSPETHEIEVFTATWTATGGRMLTPITSLRLEVIIDTALTKKVSCSGCQTAQEDTLFPGLKYGFNRRHLLVSTNIVSSLPFRSYPV